ncbi:CBU_1409 family Dot/Icm T4SS effector, partial [Coxiella burnetii]
PQIKRTEAAEGPFDVFISDLNINLSEKDTFSFFDAAFRFYFEATTLHYRNSNPTFTDCLSFLKARASWLSNCNLAISGFKNILKEFNFLRNENIEQKPREKMTEVLNQLTRLFNFFRDVKRMNLTSTVLEGLGDELKLILASDDLKSLIPNWINTQEKEILPYLPKRRSQNGSEALRFWHSLSEEKLSEHSPVLPTIDVRCD